MREETKVILEQYEVRKSAGQKEAFWTYLCPLLRANGYAPEIKLEKGSIKSRNIIVGDPDTAKLIFTAHYDTCAVLPIPNFITPRNALFYGLYQALLIAGMIVLGALAEIVVLVLWELLAGDAPLWAGMLTMYAAMIFCVWWMLAGKANRHTANDNTSGVAVLLELLLALPEEVRGAVCCIFFDNEEKGLLGSKALAKRCENARKDALVINFDCVSDGDFLQLFPSKALKGDEATLALLERCFAVEEDGKTGEVVRSFGFYPSDQKNFSRGVGVCALKKSRLFGYYMDKIHTRCDTNFDERNIDLLCESALRLAREYCAKEEKE